MSLVSDHVTEFSDGFLVHPLIKLAECTVELGVSILWIQHECLSEQRHRPFVVLVQHFLLGLAKQLLTLHLSFGYSIGKHGRRGLVLVVAVPCIVGETLFI